MAAFAIFIVYQIVSTIVFFMLLPGQICIAIVYAVYGRPGLQQKPTPPPPPTTAVNIDTMDILIYDTLLQAIQRGEIQLQVPAPNT